MFARCKMIVDIEKIAEDDRYICYKGVCGDNPINLFLVSKSDFAVTPIVTGHAQSVAGALAKLTRVVKGGEFPRLITLATG